MKKLAVFVILLGCLLFVQAGINKCRHKLLERCICSENYIDPVNHVKFVVNCTNVGFTNTDALQLLPEETNILIFTGNHLDILPVNIFGETADLSELEVIDMSNNGIKEIKGKTFHHVTNVKRLILNHNDISINEDYERNFHHPRVFSNFVNLEELHLTNAFADNTDAELAEDLHDIFFTSNLTKLYKLHLEQNEIKSWKDKNLFCDLPNLHDLHLGDNKIPSLNFNIHCLKKLRYLDLEDNNITAFSEKDLNEFDGIANIPNRKEHFELEISNNPLYCDSAVRDLYPWIQTTLVKVRNSERLQCKTTKRGQKYGVNIKSLSESSHTKISQALTVLLVILVCILLTLLSAYIYLKKDSVRTKLSPVFDAITRKVQYTTIESQDV